MTTKEGKAVQVYDTQLAGWVDEGDLIIIDNDPIIVTSVLDENESVLIKGESEMTGDSVIYILPFDKEVDLWTA